MVLILMGVTGAGKTTVGRLLAAALGWDFVDGDDFHSPENVEKMRRGIPLDDEDRNPWLERLHAMIEKWSAEGRNVLLACSALKRSYREVLDGPGVRFVYLKGDSELIAERLRARHGHFAGEKILAGQFRDLEEPEGAVCVDVAGTPDEIVAEIRRRLGI